MKRIAIIGGGASGLACAAAAAEAARAQGERVQLRVFESSDRIGRPILATGNGRCNFTNSAIDASVYESAIFVGESLDEFERIFPRGTHPNGVAAFFAEHGMLYREEGEGRLYPLANKASVVLDVLRRTLAANEVEAVCEAKVASVDAPPDADGHFTMRMSDGAFERADEVVIACGGRVARDMLPDGFGFADQRPVLCSLATDPAHVRELDNIRAKATLGLVRDGAVVACEAGEVMFRKYGISGICAFNLSRLAQPGDFLSVDFLPFLQDGDVEAFVDERLASLGRAFPDSLGCGLFLAGMVLPRVADELLKRCGVGEDDPATAPVARRLAESLKDYRAEVKGPGDVEHAQVWRGGFAVSEFNPATLESKAIPRLHVVGEALDVDGPCGGYNLHWAFASGMLAGRSCVS